MTQNRIFKLERSALFIMAYAVVIIAFALIWRKFPEILYNYRDGEYNLWMSLQYTKWAHPFDLTAINPLQGMTSMLVSLNPYFDPGQWVFFLKWPHDLQILSSYGIYALEVMLSTLGLGIVLGFSRLHSFAASIWVVMLLFPPFNFMFGLAGWFVGAPLYAHTLTLNNLCVIAYLNLGKRSTIHQSNFSFFCKSILWVTLISLLIIAILLAAPFYNAGMLIGTLSIFACIGLCSQTREQFYWRLFTGFAIIAVFYAFGLPEFYASAKAYTARYSTSQSLFEFIWPNATNWQNSLSNASYLLCAWGVYCHAFSGWPFSFNTLYLMTAIIAGSITAGIKMPKPASRLGIYLMLAWLATLLISVLMVLGIVSSIFTPQYFYLMLYSLLGLYSLSILTLLIKVIHKYTKLPLTPTRLSLTPLIVALIVSISLVFIFYPYPVKMKKVRSEGADRKSAFLLDDRHQLTPIIQLLRQEIALNPGVIFRGSVATIYGSPEGTLWKMPAVKQSTHIMAGQFEELLTAAAQSGSTHDLLDLWAWNIPTLSEYGQGVSRSLKYYIAKFLSSPQDAIEFHFAFPHKPNIDILQALGVRFVIIDAPLFDKEVTLRQKLNAGKNSTLFLYELSHPNLGHYSPTHLIPLKNKNYFYQKIKAAPKCLEREAYVDLPIPVKLTPAYDAKMMFQKRGVHITAKSKGTSTLLLPIQFSHCYRAEGQSQANVKIMRANLIHTLLIFSGNLDTNLIWELHWKHSQCRQQDAQDVSNLLL